MSKEFSVEVNGAKLEVVQGDITQQDTDAIVNAANNRLAPGGGVAGAIHRAAGPGLWEECKKLGGCKTGEAKITGGHRLRARHVIHTVGPVYSGSSQDPILLAECYRNSLQCAIDHGVHSIAFPALSTGIFGYPMEEAARVAFRTIIEFLKEKGAPQLVRLVLYDGRAFEIHKRVLSEIVQGQK